MAYLSCAQGNGYPLLLIFNLNTSAATRTAPIDTKATPTQANTNMILDSI